jgi:hypothetical protein
MAAAASAGDAGNGAGAEDAQRWDQMLDRLSSMISGKRKADGSSWQDAHENMPVYLQVGALTVVLSCTPCCSAAQLGCQQPPQ